MYSPPEPGGETRWRPGRGTRDARRGAPKQRRSVRAMAMSWAYELLDMGLLEEAFEAFDRVLAARAGVG